MHFTLLHHAEEPLPGDFELPGDGRDRHPELRRVRRSADAGLLALKRSSGGTGIWTADGKLLFYCPKGADLCWEPRSGSLLSLEMVFGPCGHGPGIRHALKRLDPVSFAAAQEAEVCVPFGTVDYLALSHRSSLALATWRDAAEWGYVFLDVDRLTQLPGGLFHPYPTMCPPAFSPDDRHVVACHSYRRGWWTDDEEFEEAPSSGGWFDVGVISVQDVPSGAVSRHPVSVELPSGWMPDRPGRPEWSEIWGPEFLSDRAFRFWLPDGGAEAVSLPLPPVVQIRRPLATTR